ncbi:hypothetical protein [Sphingobacterium wenxiniae]|uniref:DUF3575 domain-containing protein n=1 Tax=Sphingobacterium wenxiniae TaxID=683125 RepID=A0A1I6R716_9SPHI|nr:hypothetical protein [Sphingobacterium wenxiniae]SFS60455.1 hypothetical protein SAMN05660206_103146 [Sphingobacterium wenxiniae]
MRKILLLVSLLALSWGSYGQESRQERALARKNHLMIDPIVLIAGPILNVSYERALNEDLGVGLHSLLGLGAMDEMVQFSPFARFYLGGSHGAGFFMEGFVPVTNMEDDYQTYNPEGDYYTIVRDKKTSVGLGIGLGGKWLLKRNLMLEVSGGIGRKLINKGVHSESITGKWMIGFGYAF